MMYSCAPAARGSTAGSTAVVKNRKGKSLRIDIHCHYLNPDAAAKVAPLNPAAHEMQIKFANAITRETNKKQVAERAPKLSNIEVRLKDMDRQGIDIQAVSPAPQQTYYWTEPKMGAELARQVNERLAEIVAKWPERFVGLGTVPLQDPDLAVSELTYLVKNLGMRGVEINGSVNGMDLTDGRLGLDKFFAKVQELDVIIFMHPTGYTQGERLLDHYFNNVIGNPLETTIALSHLIFEGTLDQFPGLKICAAHGGGYLPSYAARSNAVMTTFPQRMTKTLKKKPTEYVRQLYVDTIVFTPEALRHLAAETGPGQILMGTDYPFPWTSTSVDHILGTPELSDADKIAMLGGTAMKLLGIPA
jgi:aminocarboxymuconate-semialdehyde decarboxylase